MPFINRTDAERAYNSFVRHGLPQQGAAFEAELVKLLFEEMRGSNRWSIMFLGHGEYQSYRFCADELK